MEDTNIEASDIHYVLLHTVTSLDFASVEGVCLYEWNTFRNLLRRGHASRIEIAQGGKVQLSELQAQEVLPVENPEAVGQFLIDRVLQDNIGSNVIPCDPSTEYGISLKIPQTVIDRLLRRQRRALVTIPQI